MKGILINTFRLMRIIFSLLNYSEGNNIQRRLEIDVFDLQTCRLVWK